MGVQLVMYTFFYGEKMNLILFPSWFEEKFVWLETLSRKIGGHEEHCFFSLKCFHSLNKFNKTSFDWQEGALPQCLLFALTFLVSSCAPFWMRWRLEICAAHTHYRLGTSGTFMWVSAGLNVLLMTNFKSVILCHWEFCKLRRCTVQVAHLSQQFSLVQN